METISAILTPAARRALTPGELLAAWRYHHSTSQTALAAQFGTTQSAVSRIESGLVHPGRELRRAIKALTGVAFPAS